MNQNINVDLIPKFAVYGNLYFSQYDVGREAIINLVNGSTEYEIPSGATVTLVATKPSGLGFTQNCTFEGNQITVVCTAEMTDEAGHFPCEIRIANGSLLLGTANFTFNVERSPHPEGTTDGTADSVISQITVAFESAMTQIENSGGLTNDIKEALLNCFQKVAWIDDQGQTYYDALEEALYNVEVTGITLNFNSLLFNELNQTSQLTATLIPSTATNPVVWTSSDTSVCTVVDGLVTSVGYGNATITASAGSVSATCSVSIVELTVVSLNAVLNGGTFYVGDPVDSIKPYLTVTANWNDSTSTTVPSGSYTLSGSLSNAGANTITVSYGGQSTTVTVNAVSVELVSISAVYTQSGTVYNTDTLDSLKSDLVVTATYSDSSTATVPSTDYTLSGTLTEGTSTITVSYGNQTTTFTVTVSPAPTPQVVTAINLPYGAYIDTEYVPTSVNHKYQLGVQLLSSEVPAANAWFAGMNRLPASTIGAEEYWHIYFGTGNQANSKNDTYIQWSIGAYPKDLTSGNLRTSDSPSKKGSLITQTPFYIRIANGLQQIRANEAMTETLTSGDFAYMGSQAAYNAVTAENPIDSFFIGKLNQKGLRTVTEYQGGVKIFCFRVFDENNTLLVDMHPAVLGADVGMYDSVRNEFYTASGTGATYDE